MKNLFPITLLFKNAAIAEAVANALQGQIDYNAVTFDDFIDEEAMNLILSLNKEGDERACCSKGAINLIDFDFSSPDRRLASNSFQCTPFSLFLNYLEALPNTIENQWSFELDHRPLETAKKLAKLSENIQENKTIEPIYLKYYRNEFNLRLNFSLAEELTYRKWKRKSFIDIILADNMPLKKHCKWFVWKLTMNNFKSLCYKAYGWASICYLLERFSNFFEFEEGDFSEGLSTSMIKINRTLLSEMEEQTAFLNTIRKAKRLENSLNIKFIQILELDIEMSATPITQKMLVEVSKLPQIKTTLTNRSYFKGENLPVDTISYYEAVEFCDRLSKLIGEKYDLPTWQEWEYAAKAHTNTRFYWGDEFSPEYANFRESGIGSTTEVGSYPANPWRFYDMLGNVIEWCKLHFDDTDYSKTLWEGNPPQNNWVAPLRGGDWNSSYTRWDFNEIDGFSADPTTSSLDGNFLAKYIGFRIVKRI